MMTDDLHGYYFEDLEVGMTASFGKTITEADVMAFAGVSGDINPTHINEQFARTTRFQARIVHGMLTASLISAVLGCKLPGPGCLYLNQTSSFRAPVMLGDTVTALVVLRGLKPEKNFAEFDTTCSVDDTLVVDGSALLWVPSRSSQVD